MSFFSVTYFSHFIQSMRMKQGECNGTVQSILLLSQVQDNNYFYFALFWFFIFFGNMNESDTTHTITQVLSKMK